VYCRQQVALFLSELGHARNLEKYWSAPQDLQRFDRFAEEYIELHNYKTKVEQFALDGQTRFLSGWDMVATAVRQQEFIRFLADKEAQFAPVANKFLSDVPIWNSLTEVFTELKDYCVWSQTSSKPTAGEVLRRLHRIGDKIQAARQALADSKLSQAARVALPANRQQKVVLMDHLSDDQRESVSLALDAMREK